MPADLILAIDQGTHSTRAIVFDGRGQPLATSRRPVALTARSHTEIEQSADEIARSMHTVIDAVLADPAVDSGRVRCAGLATQRSSVVAWERSSGTPLSPVLSWQDRRTAAAIELLHDREQHVEARTGLHLSPHYGAGKLQWLLQQQADVRAAHAAGKLLMGPLASYLLFQLLDGQPALVDHANASRTLLWNLQTRDWDADMLSLFAIPREVLPACRPIVSGYGRIPGHDIPLTAVNGDQTAALYAQGNPPDGTLIVNIGTGAFVLMPTTDVQHRPAGLLAGISHSEDGSGHYYIEGTVNGAAAAVEHVAKQFDVADLQTALPDWLNTVDEPTLFINTVGGLGAPWWRSGPQPYFLNPDVAEAEAMVAVIESIVFLLEANIELLRRHDAGVRRIRISGGLANLDGLCRKLADLSGLEVHRPVQVEATARGIAWQAAGSPDDWPASGAGETFSPGDNPALQARYERFTEILKNSL
jgi:glycerol kinase